MASLKPRTVGHNSQAAKVILSQLYVSWATESEGMRSIKEAIQDLLSVASKPGAASLSTSGQTNGGSSAVGNNNKGARRGTTTTSSRYADPSSDGMPHRSHSPPVTPPSRNKRRPDEENDAPLSTSSRFAERSSSPGVVAPSSPIGKAGDAVPLPHGTVSPGGTTASSVSPPNAHPTMEAAVTMDIMPTVEASAALAASMARESGSRGLVLTGGYAASPPPNLQRASLDDIPVFYTKKESLGMRSEREESELSALADIFALQDGTPLRLEQYDAVCANVFKVPRWLREAVFEANAAFVGAADTAAEDGLTESQVRRYYTEKMAFISPSRRLFELIRSDDTSDYLSMEDLKTMTRYLLSTHPGLEFLQQPEFQQHYCLTVALRIMYALEWQQRGRISWRDFDRSDLPDVMMDLDGKDVNQVLQYFSYEHFYVLYCKFWELDTDRDFKLDFNDLCGYNQGSVVPSVIQRVVDGYGRPLSSGEPGRLSYEDFVYFCLSEEDKNSEPAVLYWFKVLDIDGDGILSGYELSEFYRENRQRFIEVSETGESDIAYEDAMCQMLDMLGFDRIKSRRYGVSLGDLRACPTPANFFNMIFNANKFLMFEHRDPFYEHHQKIKAEKTEWDRFAREEYDRMASEAQV